MISQQRYYKAEKKAQASFTLKEYANLRGYDGSKITRQPSLKKELIRDILSGAITCYRTPFIKDGKEYELIGSLYQIEKPKDSNDPYGIWTITFNGRYGDAIIDILNQKAKTYFKHQLKEIADKETTKKPYLHDFYNQLVYRRRKSEATMPIKICNLLESMKWPDKITKRPQECFDRLKECCCYFSKHYPEELEVVTLYNNYNKEETEKISITLNESFKEYTYKDFRDKVEGLKGIERWQDALISFRGKPKETKKPSSKAPLKETQKDQPQQQTEQESKQQILNNKLISNIIRWSYENWPIKKSQEEVRAYLVRAIEKLGYEKLEHLFAVEGNKYTPSGIDFLFSVLPQYVKDPEKPIVGHRPKKIRYLN